MVFHVVLFCRVCPLSSSTPSSLASSSFILLYLVSLPSFLSFSHEINTHGWAGRATGEPRRLGDQLRERVPSRMGKKLRNAKYYCASSPPPVLSRDLTLVIILTALTDLDICTYIHAIYVCGSWLCLCACCTNYTLHDVVLELLVVSSLTVMWQNVISLIVSTRKRSLCSDFYRETIAL